MDKISLVLLLGSAVTNALASTIMKHAYGGQSALLSSGVVNAFLKILLNPWILLGLGLFGISFFFMAAVFSRTDLTLAYPLMSGMVYVILLFIGFFLFHEKVTVIRMSGVALILMGITLLSIKG